MRRFLTIFLLLAFLVGCSGPANLPDNTVPDSGPSAATPDPGAQPSSDNGPVTISYAAWESERAIYEPLIKKFTADNPNIKVVLVPLEEVMNAQDSNGQDNPLTMLRRLVSAADTAPAFFVPPEAFSSGLLMDLTPLMQADANFKRDDFYAGTLEQYTFKDSVRLLPRYLSVQTLSYNKDLFSAANLPEPKPDWTWNDLLGVAEQLSKKNGSSIDTYGFLDSSGGFLPLLALLESQGVDLLNTPAHDLDLTRPEIAEAIQRVRDLTKSGALFQPTYKGDGPGVDMQQLIRDGKVAIWSSDMASFGSVDGPVGQQQPDPFSFKTGIVPFPSSGAGFFFAGSDGYIVSAGTEHPNEAWKWIEFLSRQPVDQNGPQSPGVPTQGRVPARQSLAEQTNFWNGLDAETTATYRWVIAHPAKPLERTPDYIGINALSQALSQIISEDKDPRSALAEAQKQLQDQVAEVQLTPSPTPDNNPVLVATPEPQDAPEGATTITFAVPGYSTSDMRRVVRSFQQQHPELFVKVTSTDSFTGPVELKDVARTSDCFTWFATPQSEDDFKALLDIQPLFDSDGSFPQSDYPSALLTPYQHNGGLFGLPYAFNLRTLNYNRTAFSAAGVTPPSDSWKPADFLAAAQALTSGEGDKKQYGYIPLGGAQQDLFFFIGQFGSRLTKGSGADLRPNFDDPKVIEAIQWYIDLAKVHKVTPPFNMPYRRDDPGPIEDHSYELVQGGRAGMWFDQGYGMFGGSKGSDGGGAPQQNFEVGLAPLPVGGGGLHSADFYERGFHISAQTQQSQGCWELLKFLSSDVNNLQGSIPARSSVAKSDAYVKQAQPGMTDVYALYANALKRESQPGDDPNVLFSQKMDLYWFFKAIDETVNHGAALDSGLAEAQKTTTAFVECVTKGGEAPKCATQVDSTYQGYNVDQPQNSEALPARG